MYKYFYNLQHITQLSNAAKLFLLNMRNIKFNAAAAGNLIPEWPCDFKYANPSFLLPDSNDYFSAGQHLIARRFVSLIALYQEKRSPTQFERITFIIEK